MKKIYDVYFTVAEEACIAIEAENEDDAEERFNAMTKSELLEYIINAIEYGGFHVVSVDEVDECE